MNFWNVASSRQFDPFTAAASLFSMSEAKQQRKAAKSATEAAASRQAAAEKSLAQAQETASAQAQARVEQRRRRIGTAGRTIFTSPLGIAGSATTARKKLLGE